MCDFVCVWVSRLSSRLAMIPQRCCCQQPWLCSGWEVLQTTAVYASIYIHIHHHTHTQSAIQEKQIQRIISIILHLINSSSCYLWIIYSPQCQSQKNSERDLQQRFVLKQSTNQTHSRPKISNFRFRTLWDYKWQAQISFIHFLLITQQKFRYVRMS